MQLLSSGDKTYKTEKLLRDCNENMYWILQEKDKIQIHTCDSSYSSSGWSPGETLAHNACIHDATLNKKGEICAVIVDNHNNFIYLRGYPGNWEEENFNREEKIKTVNGLQLLADHQQKLHLIYLLTVNNGERWWLLHHRFNGSRWEEPRVIDFGSFGATNYGHALVDHWNRLHLVYRVNTGNEAPLYYRLFSTAGLNWSKASQLAPTGENSFPFLAEDINQNLHLVWCCHKNNRYIILYRQRMRGGWPIGRWYPPLELSSPLEKPGLPYLKVEEARLTAYWLTGGEINQRCSLNSGKKWGEVETLPLEEGARPVKLTSPSPGDQLPRPSWFITNEEPLPQHTPFYREEKKSPKKEDELTGASKHDSRDMDLQVEKSRSLEQPEAEKCGSEIFAPRAEITRSQHQLHEEQKRLETLKQKLVEKDKEMMEMEQNFNQVLSNLKQKFQQSRNQWNEEIARLKKENKELQIKYQKTTTRLKNKEEETVKLNKNLTSLRSELSELKKENSYLKEKSKSPLAKFLRKILQNK